MDDDDGFPSYSQNAQRFEEEETEEEDITSSNTFKHGLAERYNIPDSVRRRLDHTLKQF